MASVMHSTGNDGFGINSESTENNVPAVFDEDVLLWIVTVERHVLEDLYPIPNLAIDFCTLPNCEP